MTGPRNKNICLWITYQYNLYEKSAFLNELEVIWQRGAAVKVYY